MYKYLLISLSLLFCIESFSQNSKERNNMVAILDLTDRNQEDNTRLFAAEQMAIAAGFPYIITTIISEAATYGMILSSSDFNSSTFTNQEVDTIRTYVNAGGRLITSNMKDYRMNDIFGVSSYTTTRDNYTLNWDIISGDSSLVWFDTPREQEIILGNTSFSEVIFTRYYSLQTASALAYFNNDLTRPAVTKNKFGNGYAYILGYSLRDVSLRNQLNFDFNAQRDFINRFEPNGDVHVLFLRAVFAQYGTARVWKHTSLANSFSSIIVTHNIGSQKAIDTMLLFSDWEKRVGINADYNVATRYFADSILSDFYAGNEAKVNQVIADGHTINNHSVGNFPDFQNFEPGPFGLTLQNYLPFNNGDSTVGGFLFPEVQVAQQIIQSNHSTRTRAFRAGYFRYPEKIANVLDTLDYRYESSLSTNDLGWSFPFPLKKDHTFSGEVTDVYEISITFSDQNENGLNQANWQAGVSGWINSATEYADNHSPVSINIQPNSLWKLNAEQALLTGLGNKFFKTTIAGYGDYWRNRMTVDFTSYVNTDTLFVIVNNADYPLDEYMSFMAEGSSEINEVIVQTQSGINIPMNVERLSQSNRMLIYNGSVSVSIADEELKGSLNQEFKVYPNPNSGSFSIASKHLLGQSEVELFDLTGRQIHSSVLTGDNDIVNLNLPQGMYLIRLSNSGNEIGTELMIVK